MRAPPPADRLPPTGVQAPPPADRLPPTGVQAPPPGVQAPPPTDRLPSTGYSLPELLVATTIVGVLVAFAIRPLSLAADRMAVRAAAAELSTLFAEARERAVATRGIVAVVIDTARGTVAVRAHDSTMAIGDVRRRHGVELAASRDSMSYDPRGLGFGAANLSLLVRRGRVAETLSVSRLGRVRR